MKYEKTKLIKRTVLFLAITLSITACETTQQMEQRQQAQIKSDMEEFSEVCKKAGFKPGSDNMIKCIGQQNVLKDQERNRALANDALMQQGFLAGYYSSY